MTIKKSNVTDHKLSEIISFHDMKRNTRKETDNIHYYANDNYTMEILIIYDNTNNTRDVYINE